MWRTDNDALAFKWVMVKMVISAVAVNMLECKNGRARKQTVGWGFCRHRKEARQLSSACEPDGRDGKAGASGCVRLRVELPLDRAPQAGSILPFSIREEALLLY